MSGYRTPSQSTAYRALFKAFLSASGGEATAQTIAITISKNGGAFGNPSAGATNATEIANGWYYVDLSTTDTNTLGPLAVRGTAAAINDVGVDLIVGTNILDKTLNAVGVGTVTTGGSTTSIPTSAFSPAGAGVDQFAGRSLIFLNTTATAALQGQSRTITASSNSATPTFTVAALTTAPSSGDVFIVT